MLERAGGSDDGDDGDAALATPSAAPLLAPASAHPAAARVSADEENATRKVPSRPDGAQAWATLLERSVERPHVSIRFG